MASLLKSLTAKKATSSAATSAAPKIVKAGFEDSVGGPANRDQQPTSAISLSTVDTAQASSSNDSLGGGQQDVPIEDLRALHLGWGEEGCRELRRLVESQDGWHVWEDKKGLKIEKMTNEHGRFVGRGQMTWTVPLKSEARKLAEGEEDGPLYDIDFIDQFLWDEKTKSQYDEFTERMLVMHDHENVDCHVVDQIFKGRFGISGRDFVVTIMKKRDDDEQYERLLIGASSIPLWHVEQIERLLKPEKVDDYNILKNKVVRGFVYAAGFLLEHKKGTAENRIVYLNDADVKSRGVPRWIVNRVKLDQLKIVQAIPQCLLEAALAPPPQTEAS